MKPIYLLLFSIISLSAFAQDINVRGKVLDAITNEGIISATVKIKNGTTGAVTDINGNFSLMAAKGSTLEVSAVGYKAAEVAAQSSVSILLNSSVNDLSNVTVVGTRDVNRSVANSPVPIDIINLKTATKLSPQLDLNQMLTYLEPSFNSVRQSSSDGTEHIDPASLRGLGPDQTLVLINGKRRHNTSLLNNQGTFGNGSVGTDLNAIPSSAIDHIEILRDGASAQYGSDAIAGVINIVLKKNTNALNAGLSGGITSLGDGATSALNLNWGGNLGKNGGFLNLTGEVYYRGKTTRTQNHNLIIFDQSALGNYFAYAFANDSAISRAYDDSVLASQNLTRDDFNFQVGDAQIKNGSAFFNLSLPSANGRMEFYSFGGFSYRDGDGFGFRRLPSEYQNMVYSIFPNGFQPNTGSHIYDESFAAGLRLKTGEWNWDISNTLGDNRFDFFVNNTVNASMQAASPTSFTAGGHEFLQNTTNVDLDRNFNNVLKGFNLAFGGEFRYEQYQIREGEEASWKNFGLTTLPDGTVEDTLGLAGGSQSFPGFQPYNAGTHSRTNGALYVDGALQLTDKWLIDAAARFENYSDFGSAVSGKLATRFAISKSFALRGAVSNGFRAPSLAQEYFSYVGTDIVNGKLANTGIFPNKSDVAAFIGIPKLTEESSMNASAGFSITPGNNFSLTIDGYYIKVNNRITLTGNFGQDVYGSPDSLIQSYLLPFNAEAARFLTNSVDTRTMGLDVVALYHWYINTNNNIDFTLAANMNDIMVTEVNPIPEKLQSQPDIYFSPAEQGLIETVNPKQKLNFSIQYHHNKFSALLRNEYFGSVARNAFPFGTVQTFGGKLVTDLSLSYDFNKIISASIGANNLFNAYPDEQVYPNSYFGVFKYAPVQMGTTGTFYFLKIFLRIGNQ